jgi:hypothetical protein
MFFFVTGAWLLSVERIPGMDGTRAWPVFMLEFYAESIREDIYFT